MRTGRASLGFVLLGLVIGCGDDGTGGTTDTTMTPGTTTTPSTMSGTTSGTSSGGTTSVDPTTGALPGTTTTSETTADPSTSTGPVEPSTTTTATTTSGDGTTTTGGESTAADSSSGGSSSGEESSTGEPVVCPPPDPNKGACEQCMQMNCCTEMEACFMDQKCTCIFNCIYMTNGPMGCAFQCMNVGMQNPTLGDMFICGQDCQGCNW